MADPHSTYGRLEARLTEALAFFDIEEVAIEDLEREVRAYGKRRCDADGSVDNRKYRIGAAFEVHHALDIDDVALTGLLNASFGRLAQEVDHHAAEDMTLLDAILWLLKRDAIRPWSKAKGRFLHWRRLKTIYERDHLAFLESDAYRRKNWRRRNVRRGQHYLIGRICELMAIEKPAIVNCGEAFEFIRKNGGNPSFWQDPSASLPTNERGRDD